ncbi:MAG: ATP-binding cassette domain-containing protein, partial [Pseudomonadales bacterium]
MLVDTDFSIESGERVCLIGRNGTGKSTLMKIVSGEYQPDRGDIQYRDNLRISVLDQQLPVSGDEIVFDIVRQGLARQIQLIEDFRKLSDQTLDQNGLKDLEELQSMIEAGGGWQPDQQVETIVSQLDLPAYSKMSDLSGGWCRRVALAQALVSNPELLMLDEPTNHLDISTIEWL